MDRRTFLLKIWKNLFKPIILILVIYFYFNFLYNVFTESGIERFLITLILGLGIVYVLAILLRRFVKYISRNINLKLSKPVKIWLRVLSRFLDYIAPIFLGMVIYHFGKEDWEGTAIVLGILLFEKITDIIKEEKQIEIK